MGNQEYRRKQREVLGSDINLIEIDLLRRGSHAVAPPQDSIVRQYGMWDYLVSLSRARDRSEFELWLLSVRRHLPEIRVPLLAGDTDVNLDMQDAFNRCYDEDHYERSIHYEIDPYFLLAGEDTVCTDQLLRENGLCSARS